MDVMPADAPGLDLDAHPDRALTAKQCWPGAATAVELVRSAGLGVASTDTVVEAARIMRDADIEVVPVVEEDGSIHSLISARAIVVSVVARGTRPKDTLVEEIAYFPRLVVAPVDSAGSLLQLMREHGTDHALVRDDHKAYGVVSRRDVTRQPVEPLGKEIR